MEFALGLLAEGLDHVQDLEELVQRIGERRGFALCVCKSLCDSVLSKSAPLSTEDRRASIDILMLRESKVRHGLQYRWIPACLQAAGGLTKDTGKAAALLRLTLRQGYISLSADSRSAAEAQEYARRWNKPSWGKWDSSSWTSQQW